MGGGSKAGGQDVVDQDGAAHGEGAVDTFGHKFGDRDYSSGSSSPVSQQVTNHYLAS